MSRSGQGKEVTIIWRYWIGVTILGGAFVMILGRGYLKARETRNGKLRKAP